MYTILVLDEEQKHLFAIREYLRSKGFNTFISRSPLDALILLEKLKPDLLILDIIMPDMDGSTFINKLKASSHLSQIPFIFLTAKGMTQDRIKGYKLGCSGYISKPFDPDELVAMIDNIFYKEEERQKEIIKAIKQIKRIRFYLEQQYYLADLNSSDLVLTPQENRILNYLIKGLRNKEIASQLHTSVRNIEKYVTKLLNKTNTTNRTSLVRFIYLNNFNQLTENSKANDGDRTRE